MAKNMNNGAVPAAPEYAVGDMVLYVDKHNRVQSGEVLNIEARWVPWSMNGKPLITYRLRHPTYRNRQFWATGKDIVEMQARAEGREPAS